MLAVHWFNAEKQINAGNQMNVECRMFECQVTIRISSERLVKG